MNFVQFASNFAVDSERLLTPSMFTKVVKGALSNTQRFRLTLARAYTVNRIEYGKKTIENRLEKAKPTIVFSYTIQTIREN